MLHGIATLFLRSLRLEARLLRTHLFRLAFVLVIYAMMFVAQLQSMMYGAPGQHFFVSMSWLNAIAVALGGVSFFSSAITEEKEEDTIGLLMMANINPLGILLGKSTARLVQALLLLTIQFPFTLLAITLGGVTISQVVAMYIALLAFTVCLSNVGLLASVVSRRAGTAAAISTVWMIGYAWIPAALYAGMPMLPSLTANIPYWQPTLLKILGLVAESSVFTRLIEIPRTGFDESPFSVQVIGNCLFGLACFLASWWLFPRFALQADVQGVSRGWLQASSSTQRLGSAGRAWTNPLIWKEYYFLTGGMPYVVLKVAGCVALYGVIFAFESSAYGSAAPGELVQPVVAQHCGWVIAFLALEAAIYASRLFHDEIRGQTLSSLLMLPRSIAYVAYSKMAGAMLGLLPTAGFALFDGVVLAPNPDVWAEAVLQPGVWYVVVIYSAFLHLVALLSLFVKWGALPLAFLILLFSSNCCGFALLFPLMFAGEELLAQLIALAIVGMMFMVSTFVFQMMIHARLYELGAK